MMNIKLARQVITGIHHYCPQGLRKTLRDDMLTKSSKPGFIYSGFVSPANYLKNLYFRTELPPGQVHSLPPFLRHDYPIYLQKIFDKEAAIVAKKVFKKLGVVIKNKLPGDLSSVEKISLLDGLIICKNAGLKLPNKIVIKDLGTYSGNHDVFMPNIINVNLLRKRNEDIGDPTGVVVHEIIHKNDALNTFKRLMKSTFHLYDSDEILLRKNSGLVENELEEYATKEVAEFVACTAQALLREGKKWSDFNPKIKELYEKFKGPKLKLD